MKVFISHSNKDEEFVKRLGRDLRTKEGIDAWLAQWEIIPGDRKIEKIEEGLLNASIFLFILSPNSIECSRLKYEREAWLEIQISEEEKARKEKRITQKRLVPILYKNCEVPGFLKALKDIKIDDENYTEGLEELVNTIKGISIKPPLNKKDLTTEIFTASYATQRKYVLSLLEGLLPSQFKKVLFLCEIDNSLLSEKDSQTEQAITLIKYSEQKEGKDLARLLQIIYGVAPNFGGERKAYAIELLEKLEILSEGQFEKLLFQFMDKNLIANNVSQRERAIEFLYLATQKEDGLKKLEEALDKLKIINLTHSINRYKEVYKEIYSGFKIDDNILASISCENKANNFFTSIKDAVENFWIEPQKWHCVLIGDGGMGKTTSLLKLWDIYNNSDEPSPLPIFLRLNTYNRNMSDEERKNFIWNRILFEYRNLKPPPPDKINELKYQLRERKKIQGKYIPSVILLLDGFNEVTVDNTELISCLNEIREFKGVQIVITSRYDMRDYLNWSNYDALTLNLLKDEQLKEYMSVYKTEEEEFSRELLNLLRNPLMLSLYCLTQKEMNEYIGKEDYDFITKPFYKAEVIHNFIESILVRADHIEEQLNPKEVKVLNRLYLRHLLPRIGYEMEKEGKYEEKQLKIEDIIYEEFEKYNKRDFLRLHLDIRNNITARVREYIDINNDQNIITAFNILLEKHCLLSTAPAKWVSEF